MHTTTEPHSPSPLRVAVIGGGQNSEHDVSIASAASVVGAIDTGLFTVVPLRIARDGSWSGDDGPLTFGAALELLRSCDVAFPLLHGPRGEDGTLAALLDLAGVPYVGSGVRAGAIAMDKWTTKLVAEAVGVRTAPGTLVTRADATPTIHTAVIVKPVASGSSFGVGFVDDPAELPAAIAEALRYDDRVLVEECVVGREIDVAVLARADGSRLVGAALEIIVAGSHFDLAAKYDGSAEFRVPAALDPGLRERLERAAVTVFDALGCAGVARIDFFVTADRIVLNEVNTMPGMTGLSQVPRMFAAVGMPYPVLVDHLLRDAMELAR